MDKKVRITIISEKHDTSELLLAQTDVRNGSEATDNPEDIETEKTTVVTEGVFSRKDGRTELSYREDDASGMEGSDVCISFEDSNPGLVTLVRSGVFNTVLVFEQGKRHICVYNTPYMPFEVCIRTQKVENRLLTQNKLKLKYNIEIHGASAEHTVLSLKITDLPC